MKISPKQKKWGKRLLIFLGIRIILGAVFFYIVDYRFKDLLKFAVEDKSGHSYAFDSGDIEVSVFKKKLTVKNAVLYATDTLNTKGHYSIRLKEIYFEMSSWKELIFNQRLIVDSVSVNSPLIFYHEHVRSINKKVYNHIGDINDVLNRLLKHLRVKAFQINNASYSFKSKLHPGELSINKINFSLRNFSDSSGKQNLFNSQDIDLKLGKQQISLPDGIHSMSFSNLRFSGRKKYFQLDSFSLNAKALSGKVVTSISAAELRLKSTEMADVFKKDELVVDTIELSRPVITIKGRADQLRKHGRLRISHIFKLVHFKFVKIEQGGFARQAGSTSAAQYGSGRVDLRIHNLFFKPAVQNSLRIESVKLDVDKLSFKSEDGKTQLSVDEMAFDHNAVSFLNATYGPVDDKLKGGLSFRAPFLKLKNLSLTALLNKKIIAEQADLVRPFIQIRSFGRSEIEVRNKADFSGVFKMFRAIKNLFVVRRFNIKNGELMLDSKEKSATKITVEKLNASILADKMLNSDTTLEIKHAIPILSFKRMNVSSPKIKINVSDYFFFGKVRHNNARSLSMEISGGTHIKAKNLYWEWLDWDLYRSSRMVFIDSLKIGLIDVKVNKNLKDNTSAKTIPKLHIGNLDVKHLRFEVKTADMQAKFVGKGFFAREVDSRIDKLLWRDMGGELEQLNLVTKRINLKVAKIKMHTAGDNRIEQLSMIFGSTQDNILKVPAMNFKGRFSSTIMTTAFLEYLRLQDPELYLSNKNKPVGSPIRSTALLHRLDVREMSVKNGTIYSQMLTGSFPQVPLCRFDLAFQRLHGHADGRKLLSAQSFTANLKSLCFANQSFNLSTPISLVFSGVEVNNIDNALRFSGKAFGQSRNLAFDYRKDSSSLKIRDMSAFFNDPAFTLDIGRKLDWTQLLNKISIERGAISFQNAQSSLTVDNLSWLPEKSFFSAKDILYKPLLAIADFRIKNPWQTDYIQASVGTLMAEGIGLPTLPGQHELKVLSLRVDNVKLSSSRDKRMKERALTEKPMPSRLIEDLKIPFSIQDIKFTNSQVVIKETSLTTGMEGMILLNDINADIYNVTSKPAAIDSLKFIGQANIFGKTSIKLNYREAYRDSLSAFKMRLSISPMDLTEINQVSVPLAAVKINAGDADAIDADWEGNKYRALGQISLPYKNLRLSIMDKRNLYRKSLLLSAENELVNMVIRNKNIRPSSMFFERNRNKFVFNYWIKTLLTGFASSVGFRSERGLKKQAKTYHLR